VLKLKDTLRFYSQVQKTRDLKYPVVRNYGLAYEAQKLREQDQAPLSPLTSEALSRPRRKPAEEVRNSLGFLKRLEEEGQNVKISEELNGILNMDDEKRAIIEKLEEENSKKSKKPRPRDLYDFDELRRLHWQR
jgi:hypothetical protein